MIKMFFSCKKLTNINFDTKNVTDINKIFRERKKLKSINLTNFETKNVITNMDGIFRGCVNLKSINLSNFGSKILRINLECFDSVKI